MGGPTRTQKERCVPAATTYGHGATIPIQTSNGVVSEYVVHHGSWDHASPVEPMAPVVEQKTAKYLWYQPVVSSAADVFDFVDQSTYLWCMCSCWFSHTRYF